MKLSKEEYNKLPDKICFYKDPEKNAFGIPMPEIFSKDDWKYLPYSPYTRKIDALDSASIILVNLGVVLSLLGVLIPWILVGTASMILIGIFCFLRLYHYTKLEYYRLYQLSLTEEQKKRRELFFTWLNEKQTKIKEIKSKSLSEITMEDQDFVKRIEETIRGMEWL